LPSTLAQSWLAAANHPAIRADLQALYATAAQEITARGPACWASGRCCNFTRTGHRLYTTGLEAAFALSTSPNAAPLSPSQHSVVSLTIQSQPPPAFAPTLTPDSLAHARSTGGCPFQLNNLCTIHATKPLSCRLYFCDRSAQQWQHDLSERLLAELRTLHDRHAIDYRYAEWRDLLEQFL
jgi:Fe-S-cluster containining protein